MLEFKLTLPLLGILFLHTPMVPVEYIYIYILINLTRYADTGTENCSKIAFSKVQDSDDYNHGEDVNGG